MYVKYVAQANATLQTIRTDLIALVNGSISTANDFSVNCNRDSTVLKGTFPTGKYAVANSSNSSSLTISKIHNDYSDTTHYVKLNFSGNTWSNTIVSRGYTSGTDTMVNSLTFETVPTTLAGAVVLHIIVGSKTFYMYSDIANTKALVVSDIGKTGVSRTFTNSMLMTAWNLVTPNYYIPYVYDTTSDAYSSCSSPTVTSITPGKAGLSNGALFTVENPVFLIMDRAANTAFYHYGIVKPASLSYATHATYTDSAGGYRYYYGGYSLIAD